MSVETFKISEILADELLEAPSADLAQKPKISEVAYLEHETDGSECFCLNMTRAFSIDFFTLQNHRRIDLQYQRKALSNA